MSSSDSKRDISKFGKHTPVLDIVKGVDLNNRVAIVTGAGSGIGVETARALAHSGAQVILAVRDASKVQSVVEDIIKTSNNKKVDAMSVDLSDLKTVAAFAAAFKKRNLPLHILINNAGVMACPEGKTKDGFETQIGTNHFGHFFLTTLLLDILLASKPSRVVNLASIGHQLGAPNIEDINFTKPGSYNKWKAYGSSKSANILFSNELWRRYGSQGLTANAAHPGGIQTNLGRHLSAEDYKGFAEIAPNIDMTAPDFWKNASSGASTSTLAATAPEYEGKGGLYFEDCQPASATVLHMAYGQAAHTRDVELGKKLWALSLDLLKDHYAAVEGGKELLKKLA